MSLLAYSQWQTEAAMNYAAELAKALMAERERCAKIAEDYPGTCHWGCGEDIAERIRSGE